MKEQWPSPILDKRPTLPGSPAANREYLPITWDFMLRLRTWARWLAVHAQAHVYLVGSALDHDSPRDVDVAVVWPRERYEYHFGPTPRTKEEHDARWERGDFMRARHSFIVSAWHGVGYKPYIDVHLCPDVWYLDRPRLLLGTPEDTDAPDHWGEEEFLLRTVVEHDTGKVLFEWPARYTA